MALKTTNIISVLLLALLSPWLYDRYQGLTTLLANRPGALTPVYNIKSHDFIFRDRIRNCEDIFLDEAMGIAILSCDPGRDRWNTVMGMFSPEKGMANGQLWLYDYSHPELPEDEQMKPFTLKNFSKENDFHPLGIEFELESSTLYVVNHAQSGSAIEVFKLEVGSATATHIETFKHPLLHAPNSIHALGDGRIFVTNDHYMRAELSVLLSRVETFTAVPGGSVVFTDLKNPEKSKTVARMPFANGIAMLNSTTLAVASSSKAGVYFYEVEPDYNLKLKHIVRAPAGVDNLGIDTSGTLLLAGHPFVPTLMTVVKGRPDCVLDSEDEAVKQACGCSAPSWVGEWTEKDGLKTLYRGYEFCSSTMLARDLTRGVGFVTGLYDRGLMVIKE